MAFVILKKNPDSLGFGPGDECVDTRSWGNWHLVQRRYLIWNTHGPSVDGYDVDLWEIDSPKELLDWLFHIGGKTFDPADFFRAVCDIFRDARHSDAIDGKALAIKFWENSVPHRKRLHGPS